MDPLPLGYLDNQNTYGDGNDRQLFHISPRHRRKHMAILGTTGAGKSTLLRNMIAWDIAAGLGVSVVDPHGDLVEDILANHIPRSRINDVIHFDPKDPERSVGLNIVEASRPEQKALVVSNVISIFKKLWGDSWGPRLEDTLRNGLFALIDQPTPVSLLALPRLLTDSTYRARVLAGVRNPVVLDFFHNNYDQWKPPFREEVISPVLNKTRAFLTDPKIRAIIGQPRSSFDFRWMMDRSKILLADLSKGAIGEDNAKLLGSLIIAKEKLAALSRADIPEGERVPHVLYCEEAHNFIGDFESILSEARKFHLMLVLVTQGIDQLPAEAAFAVFTNCANIVSFRVSGRDAERLKQEFATGLPAVGLQDQADYRIHVRTLKEESEGVTRPSGPHLVRTFPPFRRTAEDADRERVVRTSKERYTRPRREIEARIARFLQVNQTASAAP